MFFGQAEVFIGGDHKNVFGRHQAGKAVEGLLDQGFAGAQNVKELFGMAYAAQGPKTAADAAGHDGDVNVFRVGLLVGHVVK